MTPTLPPAVTQFLNWLEERASDRGYPAERQYDLIVEDPRLVARTRYTVEQGRNPHSGFQDGTANFKVTKEVTAAPSEFEQVYSVFLDLHTKREWQPDKDDFYPLTTTEIEKRTCGEDANGDYPLTIDFTKPAVKAVRNDLDRLFPDEDNDDDEQKGCGFSSGDDDDGPPSSPDEGPLSNGTTSNLNRIARNISD